MCSERPAVAAVLVLAAWVPAHAQDCGQRWTVPVGGGIGKIFKVGSQPMNAQARAFSNVEKPDTVGNWSLRVQLQLLFPKGG